MAEFRLKNSKGLFYETRVHGIMSEATLQAARQRYLPAVADPKERAACAELLDLVESLPLMETHSQRSPFDPGYSASAKALNSYSQYVVMPCRAWMSVSGPTSNSPSSNAPCASPKEAGWDIIPKIEKQRDRLNRILKSLKAEEKYDFEFAGASTLKKKSSEVIFEAVDADKELAECSAWALFMTQGTESGYLDSKGQMAPLSRARMFESAAAAGRTAKSRSVSSWKAVGVSVAVTSQFDLAGDSPQDALAGIIARREAQALDKALEDAGMERLKAKLAQLEAAQGQSDPKPDAPRKARL